MAFYRGEQGTVFFDKDSSGGISEIAAVRSWSMTVEKDVLETTAQGATYKANIGGLLGGTGTMEVLYDAPGAGDKLDLIKDANTATDEGNAFVELYLDETGGKKITGSIVINSTEYGATVGELEMVTINFTMNGTITLSI
ncbi:MAG: hypothetical protein EBT15_06060 [Betaproteobacteria bacterium]|nr:hypothetical protein [Betaproteobacteria bacterium]